MGSSGSDKGIVIAQGKEISTLAITYDGILASHSLVFCRPLPTDNHNCKYIPGYDSPGIYTRDLINFPANDLPSGGRCDTTIRISPSEMTMCILQFYGNLPSITVRATWRNIDTGKVLYDATVITPALTDPYVWSFVGHFDWEIDRAGNYQVYIETGYGNAQIDFTVVDTRPPQSQNSYPVIVDATCYIDLSGWKVMCLYANGGSKGMSLFLGHNYGVVPEWGTNNPVCWYDSNLINSSVLCTDKTPYLYGKTISPVPTWPQLPVVNQACLFTYNCKFGDNCTNGTCSDYNISGPAVGYKSNLLPVPQNMNVPGQVTNLKVNAGNSALTIRWTPVDDPIGGGKKVFAYHIVITKQGDALPTAYGFVAGISSTVSVGGLTNGSKYTIDVYSISYNNIGGTAASITGIPGITDVVATTGKYHDLKSFGNLSPWTIVPATTFSYGSYPMGDLIDPQWCATAPNEALADSKSAIVACLVNLTNIFISGRVTFNWYRLRDGKLIYTSYYDIPPPAGQQMDFYSVASWMCKVPGGIDEQGNYAVEVFADPYEFYQYIPFTIECGTPVANLSTTDVLTTGSISCTTTPSGAQVWLDGTNTAQVTPYTLINITPGAHTVTFKLSGYNDCTVPVTVTAGYVVNAPCTLTKVNLALGKMPTALFIWYQYPDNLNLITDGNRASASHGITQITTDNTNFIQIDLGLITNLGSLYVKFMVDKYFDYTIYHTVRVSSNGTNWNLIDTREGLKQVITEITLSNISNVRYIRCSVFNRLFAYSSDIFWYELEAYV